MSSLIYLPIIIPFSAALLLLIHRSSRKWQKSISLAAAIGSLIAAGFLFKEIMAKDMIVAHLGNWPVPYGIVFTADLLSAIMIGISAVVGFTTLLYCLNDSDINANLQKGSFFALFQFQLFGINGAFLTGDLFNLFVFFEVILLSSYVLLTLGNSDKQAKSGFNYLTINLIGSTLFLSGAGILYGQLGTLNMADIASRITTVPNPGLVTFVSILFMCVFGIKAAMFPLNNWLPDAYTAPSPGISALFAGLLTKVGVYSMYRIFGMVFTQDIAFTHGHILIPLAGLTMILGVLGAIIQYDIRSILAFHSISQVGYILMGLALYSPLALAGGLFHMIHHSLIKSSLFLIGGGVEKMSGSQDLKKISGLLKLTLPLSIFFMISSLALAGIPPLSGFFSKLALLTGAVKGSHYVLVLAALVTSLLTLYSMIKIWRLGFWGELKIEKAAQTGTGFLWPIGISVFFVLSITVLASPLMKVCQKAGDQILNQKQYIQRVLGSNTNELKRK